MFHVFSVPWKIKSALNCERALGGELKGFITANTVRITSSGASCPDDETPGLLGAPGGRCWGRGQFCRAAVCKWGCTPWHVTGESIHAWAGYIEPHCRRKTWDLTLAPRGVTAPQHGSQPDVYLSQGESIHLAEAGRVHLAE